MFSSPSCGDLKTATQINQRPNKRNQHKKVNLSQTKVISKFIGIRKISFLKNKFGDKLSKSMKEQTYPWNKKHKGRKNGDHWLSQHVLSHTMKMEKKENQKNQTLWQKMGRDYIEKRIPASMQGGWKPKTKKFTTCKI